MGVVSMVERRENNELVVLALLVLVVVVVVVVVWDWLWVSASKARMEENASCPEFERKR